MRTSEHRDLSLRYVLSVPGGHPDDAELPLVIVMHGRGADAHDLAELAPAIDNGYRWVFPNAAKPFEAYPGMTFGFTWFDGWPPVGSTFVESRDLLLKLIDEVVARYPTPPGKLVISGFSQGGMMALDTGYRTSQTVAGIVVMSGALNEGELPPIDARKDVPVLLVHGSADDMIPVAAAHRARHVLEGHGVNVEFHEFPMGHFVTPESLGVVGNFIRKCMA